MTIGQMHYDFKRKLNKIDTQQYRNLLVPEIDWILNEAEELFVKMIAKPRLRSHLGFETSQRTIDDIRTLVVTPKSDPNACINVVDEVVTLPDNYWHFLKAKTTISKGSCTGIEAKFYLQKHDDEFEDSTFDESSFEWREVNGTFFEQGIRVYTDGTFIVDTLCLSYIKKLTYMHNAQDFRGGQYKLNDTTTLSGSVDCELPEHTHREIVDIAVALATNEIQSPDYSNKLNKLSFNHLK